MDHRVIYKYLLHESRYDEAIVQLLYYFL